MLPSFSFIVSSYLARLDTHPDEHEVRLALARAYLTNDMPRQAETILREILTAYPGTKSAAEATLLLAGLPPKAPATTPK